MPTLAIKLHSKWNTQRDGRWTLDVIANETFGHKQMPTPAIKWHSKRNAQRDGSWTLGMMANETFGHKQMPTPAIKWRSKWNTQRDGSWTLAGSGGGASGGHSSGGGASEGNGSGGGASGGHSREAGGSVKTWSRQHCPDLEQAAVEPAAAEAVAVEAAHSAACKQLPYLARCRQLGLQAKWKLDNWRQGNANSCHNRRSAKIGTHSAAADGRFARSGMPTLAALTAVPRLGTLGEVTDE